MSGQVEPEPRHHPADGVRVRDRTGTNYEAACQQRGNNP
jgi:hypothetical protein